MPTSDSPPPRRARQISWGAWAILALALVIGGYFRTLNLFGWDGDSYLHPDERFIIFTVNGIAVPRSFAEKFAEEKKITLPMVVDPQGALERKVAADLACGAKNNVQHTPTIYVVSNTETGTPFVEVVDRSELFRLIDDMKRQASAAKPIPRRFNSSRSEIGDQFRSARVLSQLNVAPWLRDSQSK